MARLLSVFLVTLGLLLPRGAFAWQPGQPAAATDDSTTTLWYPGSASTTEPRLSQNGGGAGHARQYGAVATVGSYGETCTQFNSRSAIAVLSLEAAAVPESEGTACCLQAAGAGCLFIRRRSKVRTA